MNYLRSSFHVGASLLSLCFIVAGSSLFLFAQDSGDSSFTNYQNTPVNSILDIYEQLSGKHLIRDVNLNTLPPVSINATGVTKAEMLKLIEATLLLNGIAIVPIDDTTSKVVSAAGNRNPRSEGVRIYTNASDLPQTDEVVSYYMPLNYISVQEAQTIFTQQAPAHPYGAYVPAPTAQAIVLTENVTTIRQLIALRELIDVPSARVTSEFIPLYRSDADKVADILNKLLQPTKDAAPQGQPANVPPSLGTTEPLENEHNLLSGPAQIIADSRSNRLLVITRPVNLPLLRQLVSELDKPSDVLMPQKRMLKYVSASDILPALEASIAEGKDELDQVAKDANSTTSQNSQNANNAANNTSTGSASSTSGGSISSVTSPLSAPNQSDAPKVVTIGKTQLLADTRSNSILVLGPPDVTDRVFAMIDQLDHKPLQVYLASVIGQLTVSQGSEFGIDILQKFQKVGQGGFATSQITRSDSTVSGATAAGVTPEPSTLISSTGFPLFSGLTLYGAIGSTLDAYVKALETTNRFKVIDRPSVYAANNKLAVIATGSQVPIPGTTLSGITGTSSTVSSSSTTEYINVLLQLDVIPLINPNHQVTLKIRQTNNSLGANNLISGNEIPTVNTQEINTEVTVPDKATVVIGGLIADTEKRNTSGVPLLSDIPLIGNLFKDTTKSKERDELIIMIQPTVVETDNDQIVTNEIEKQRTILGQDAVNQANATTSPLLSTANPPPAVPGSAVQPTVTPAPDVSDGRLPTDKPATIPH